jgi:hypothetical protein
MIRKVAVVTGVVVGVTFALGLLIKLLMFLGLVILIGAGLSLSVNLIVIAREHLRARRVREKAAIGSGFTANLWDHVLDVTSNESRETAEIRDAAYRDLHDADWLEAHGMPWTAGVILLDGWRATEPIKGEPPARPAKHRKHEWDPRYRGCTCGWTQKGSLSRGMEKLNFAAHVAGMAGELPARPDSPFPGCGCVSCKEAAKRNAAAKPPAHLIVDGNRVTCSEHSISGGGIKTSLYRIAMPSVGCKTCEDATELNMNAYQLSTIIGNAQGAAAAGVPRPIVGHRAETE